MKVMSKDREQEIRKQSFVAGIEHTLLWLLKRNTIVHGPDGYGSDKKVCIDAHKPSEVRELVDQIAQPSE